ncbi:MAG: helicase, partial [Frankiales bacterium]|nr:helicase [Frankiales bacterium]
MDADALLEGLTEAQAAAVTSDGAPLVILAGAGSGKTRVLTRRIAWRAATGSADPRHVLALTFTRKAAGELRQRIALLGVRDQVAAGTFHATAFTQLRRYWADSGQQPPKLIDRKVGFLGEVLPKARDAGAKLIDVATEIEWAKARMIGPQDYEVAAVAAGRSSVFSHSTMAGYFQVYEREKSSRRVVDFDDLLLRCLFLLREDKVFSTTRRWFFRHLFVDEFQDVNPLQAALLAAWRGESDDLCVVGDEKQSIYGWNGADPSILTTFCDREPQATVVHLEDNFRSTAQILTVAQSLLDGGGIRNELVAHRQQGRLPTVRAFESERAEALGIARAVRDSRPPGTSWSRIAVLARTNAQLVLIEQALVDAEVPCRVRGGAFLRNPDIQHVLERMHRSGGLLQSHLTDLAVQIQDLEGVEGPEAERAALLAELVRLGHEQLTFDPRSTVESFLQWLAISLSGESGRAADAVELSTFHAAKGLEWPVVFLIGLEDGLVPMGSTSDPASLAEERRLLYVAITRAEDELHCSWARQRTFGTHTVPRRPSPWLIDLRAACVALAEGLSSADLRDRIAEERRRLRADAGGRDTSRSNVTVGLGADPAVLNALKEWRSNAAR